ncbi:MAG: hypothetical protein LBD13_02605 [Spirochaetaceae bacterium]|nr:hypothetical protein [Spirochaetaceae bacterium]
MQRPRHKRPDRVNRTRSESFCIRSESFCIRSESFCIRSESFCIRSESSCIRSESSCTRNKSFCTRNRSFCTRNTMPCPRINRYSIMMYRRCAPLWEEFLVGHRPSKPPLKASCPAPSRLQIAVRRRFGVVTKPTNPPTARST